MRLLPILLLLLTGLGAARQAFATEIELSRDLVYATRDGVELRLDLARPGGTEAALPLIVCIHGGGWIDGSRHDCDWWLRTWAAEGWAVATIDYRLAPDHPLPAAIEDAKTAVRFLRANAGRFRLDPSRVVAFGESSGGHLALMLGLVPPAAGMEGSGHESQSSAVQAVINFGGPTDLADADDGLAARCEWVYGAAPEVVARRLFGPAVEIPASLERCSPVAYVTADAPPVLTCHGAEDLVVPLSQAQGLHDRLRAAGATERLVALAGVSHHWHWLVYGSAHAQAKAFLGRVMPGPR